jgi:hypothetical protein
MPIALGKIGLFQVNGFSAKAATGCFRQGRTLQSVAWVWRIQGLEVGVNSIDNARKASRRDAPSVLIEDIELAPQRVCDIQQALLTPGSVDLLRSVKHLCPLLPGTPFINRSANES